MFQPLWRPLLSVRVGYWVLNAAGFDWLLIECATFRCLSRDCTFDNEKPCPNEIVDSSFQFVHNLG